MLNTIVLWYTSTSVLSRQVVLFLLVPASEWFWLGPALRAENIAIGFNRALAWAGLLVLLALRMLTTVLIVLFALEFYKIITLVKSKFVARFCLALLFGWVLLPMHLIGH